MDVHVLIAAGLVAAFAATGILAWLIAAHRTERRMLRAAHMNARVEESAQDSLQQENRDLRAQLERQEKRLRALETIATDPSERIATAIEALR